MTAYSPIGHDEHVRSQPRKLKRFIGFVRRGLPSVGRYKRYAAILAPVIAAIWVLTAIYLIALPRTYTSQFSLILPGSGVGSSLNVESIGQAVESASSAFSSPTLSPTENYKQLLTADVTLRAAARLAHESEDRFPSPTIKLVDQTNLINLTITGRTAAQAHARGEALIKAFEMELDSLRADEAAKHEENDIKHLSELQNKVKAAQRKLIDFQASQGLATLDQFNARIGAVDSLREKERELRVAMVQAQGKSGRLAGTLQSAPQSANLTMRLRGDPVFTELAQRYAAANADAEQKAGTLGPRHATRAQADAERQELRNALVARGHEITGLSPDEVMRQIDIQVGDGRNNLMQAMSVEDANAEGTRMALGEVRQDLKEARGKTSDLIQQAQNLADLLREARITEAVFSSALAHLDTSKQDPFASYPLVQVLAPPSLPKKPSSPSATIGIAGATGASLIVILAFMMLWLRQPILDRVLKKTGSPASALPTAG